MYFSLALGIIYLGIILRWKNFNNDLEIDKWEVGNNAMMNLLALIWILVQKYFENSF